MNLPAGTIVDQGITSSELFDFYLIGSQVIFSEGEKDMFFY